MRGHVLLSPRKYLAEIYRMRRSGTSQAPLSLWLRSVETEPGWGLFVLWPLDRVVGDWSPAHADLTKEQVDEWNALADQEIEAFKAKLVKLRKRLEPIKSKRIFQPGSVRA